MRICIPVHETPEVPKGGRRKQPRRTLAGAIGVIDNSKPGFDVLARAVLDDLAGATDATDAALYARKATATRGASDDVIDRLSAGAVAVLVGSGD
ncbi:MAG TPA: hypothetical protein VJT84_00285 [Gaiellaceae bacterium]|nr:hypothetical protein [Gaiellaceae bacterium]